MNEYIIYEQPAAENVRNFLKCEYLWEKYNSSLAQEDIWGIKSSISALLEMSDFTQRINIKVELLKELERNIIYLDNLKDNDLIDLARYDNYLTEIKKYIENLNNIDNNPSKSIVDNDFLMQIKNKLHIPAGDNFFDMPSYLNLLSSNKHLIVDNINTWCSPFNPLFESAKLVLNIKRRNSKFENFTSSKSFFQKKLDKLIKIDLVRIKLKKNINIFPDISVNRQNINVVFKTSYGENRLSKAISDNIDFELSLSGIK
jgi:cell division protein ZapD